MSLNRPSFLTRIPPSNVRLATWCILAAVVLYTIQGSVAYATMDLRYIIRAPIQVLLVWGALMIVLAGRHSRLLARRSYTSLPFLIGIAVLIMHAFTDSQGQVQVQPVSSSASEKYVRTLQFATGLAMFVVTCVCCQFPQMRRRVLHSLFAIVTVSGLFASMQLVLGMHVSWSVYGRQFDPMRLGHDMTGYGKPVGLEDNPVSLAYAIIGPTTLAIVLLLSKTSWYNRVLLISCAVLGTVGVCVTASRSGLLGLIIGCACGFALLKHVDRKRGILLCCSAMVAVVLVSFGDQFVDYIRKEREIDETFTDARIVRTWMVYMPLVACHPTGHTFGYTKKATEIAKVRKTLGIRIPRGANKDVLMMAPHNQFLTAGVKLGWLGFWGLAVTCLYTLRLGFRGARNQIANSLTRIEFAGVTAALIAVFVHGWFHNASIYMGEMRGWFLFGMVFALFYSACASEHALDRRSKILEGMNRSVVGT